MAIINRILLAMAILLAANLLMAQEKYQPARQLLKIYESMDPVLKRFILFESLSDSVTFNMPVKFEQSVTMTCAIAEPPTSFSMQIAIPIDQVKKKSSQWRDLKSRITEIPHLKTKMVSLALIGTWMYCFRDDLQAWSQENDKAAHLFLSYGLSKFFGWKFALGFMLSIEATQSDIFGTEGRYEDTIEDLFVDVIGIAFSLKL